MLVQSSGSNVELPEELLQVLPSDPYEQLDVARRITSVALSTRVNALQSESSTLRDELADRERLIAELQTQVDSLDAALSEAADKLARADQDKVRTGPSTRFNLQLPIILFIYLFGLRLLITGEFGEGECFSFQCGEKAHQRCVQGANSEFLF